MKHTHFIEEEGELYRVLPLLVYNTVYLSPLGTNQLTQTNITKANWSLLVRLQLYNSRT